MAETITTYKSMDQQEETAEKPLGDIVAEDVSADDYMERYASAHHEWVKGFVIKMSPVTLFHDHLMIYLRQLLNVYFSFNPIGQVVGAPFVMRLDAIPSRREPDLQVILNTNPGTLTHTAMIGAADICIEIVSRASVGRDYGEKLAEYEQGGVQEYWLFDPLRRAAIFYRLTEVEGGERVYQAQPLDVGGSYSTPLLPRLTVHAPTLWHDPLPDILAVVESVRGMMES